MNLSKAGKKDFLQINKFLSFGKDTNTIYGEIHTKCPLTGTGDVSTCYKMVSYDREIVSKAGGQFIILQSQATKGNEKCKIAIRLKEENMSDLQQAHEK